MANEEATQTASNAAVSTSTFLIVGPPSSMSHSRCPSGSRSLSKLVAQPPSREEVPEPGGAARATCHLLNLASELPIAGHESALVELDPPRGARFPGLAIQVLRNRTPGRSTATSENLGAGHKSQRSRLLPATSVLSWRPLACSGETRSEAGFVTTRWEGRAPAGCSLLPESVVPDFRKRFSDKQIETTIKTPNAGPL